MSKREGRKRRLYGEAGGVHILVLALLALGSVAVITVTAFNAAMLYSLNSGIKPLLDTATHAAAMEVDPRQASYGRIVWDSTSGTNAFYRSLQRNLQLDAANQPLAGSPLAAAPIVHKLTYVTAAGYPFDYDVSITLYAGTDRETVRSVRARLYGPSVLAILEVRQHQAGGGADEPVILSSVSSVRPRN